MPRRNVDEQLPMADLPLHILLALATGEKHGWAIVKQIREHTSGRTDPSSGSLYLAMLRMKDRGLIDEVNAPRDETDARRRYYRMTAYGRRVLQAELHRLDELVALGRRHGVLDARGA
jgi:DNA-binding PadR family transcriptional regulator